MCKRKLGKVERHLNTDDCPIFGKPAPCQPQRNWLLDDCEILDEILYTYKEGRVRNAKNATCKSGNLWSDEGEVWRREEPKWG
jgi:hypothetical protein